MFLCIAALAYGFLRFVRGSLNDALIQSYSGHASRQSLEIYSRLAIEEAQEEYDRVIGRFPGVMPDCGW